MGWTHNWQRPTELPQEPFAAAARDCRKLVGAMTVALAGLDGSGDPVFTDESIEFNGEKPASCEPFSIRRVERDRRGRDCVWSFCKTQRLPYDLVVQSVLIILQHHLGDVISVGSDGGDDDWTNAKAVVSEHLGYGADFTLTVEN